jgi:WD40 repeat protein
MKNNPFLNEPTADIPLTPEHGGPILCMDVTKDIAITGSTDHGLRVYSLSTGKQLKELYSKSYGHTEWVTCISILSDGRVVSGGMDSNLCIWEAKGVKCKTITEHTGSISKIQSDGDIVLSSSYDTSVRIFDTTTFSPVGILKGVHKGPVTEFEWSNSLCVTAGRDGLVALWDINTEKCLLSQNLHKGQVSRLKLHTDGLDTNMIITAGISDGLVNIIDMRTNGIIFSKKV